MDSLSLHSNVSNDLPGGELMSLGVIHRVVDTVNCDRVGNELCMCKEGGYVPRGSVDVYYTSLLKFPTVSNIFANGNILCN